MLYCHCYPRPDFREGKFQRGSSNLNPKFMSKRNILILGVLVLLAVIAVWLLIVKKNESNDVGLDNPEQLFNVTAPADFNDSKKERLAEKLAEAKTLYEKNKDDNWTWVVFGNMYEFVREYDRAIPAYKKAIELNPNTITAVLSLADIYERQKKDYALAEEYYKRAIEIDNTKPDIYVSLARLYELKLNQPDKSEEVYLQGLKDLENNPDIMVNLILLYQTKNDTAKAAEYAKKLLALYPDNPAFQKDFGSLVK